MLFPFSLNNEKSEFAKPGNTKGGSITCTIDLLFDWLGLVCFAIVSCHTADSKPVKQEVNGCDTSPFSIPWPTLLYFLFSFEKNQWKIGKYF